MAQSTQINEHKSAHGQNQRQKSQVISTDAEKAFDKT
jgi:hypothetical protein